MNHQDAYDPSWSNKAAPRSTSPISQRQQVPLQGQRVLITYATSAIGRACAFQFVEHGCQLLLMAVVQEEKELLAMAREMKHQCETYGKPVPPMELIVFSPKDTDMLSDLPHRVGPIDLLINNLESSSAKSDGGMSPMALVQAFGPVMKQRGSGHIINLCNSADEMGYGNPTAAALKAYFQSTQREFMNSPVKITTVNVQGEEMYGEPMPADPQDVADQIMFAVSRPKHVQTFSMTSAGGGTSPSPRRDNRYMQDAQQNGPSGKNNGWTQDAYRPPRDYSPPPDSYDRRDAKGQDAYRSPRDPREVNNMSYQTPHVYNFDGPMKPGMDKGKAPFVVQNVSGSKMNHKDQIMTNPHPFAMETTPPSSPRMAYKNQGSPGYRQHIPGHVY